MYVYCTCPSISEQCNCSTCLRNV